MKRVFMSGLVEIVGVFVVAFCHIIITFDQDKKSKYQIVDPKHR